MIDPALLERTIESESVEISELKKAVVRSRAAELEADPSIGLTGTSWTHGWLRAGAGPSGRERGIRVFLIIDLVD